MRAIAAALGVVVALGALVGTQPVEAAWGDGEHMSASVTSTSLPPPIQGACAASLASFTVRWTPPTWPEPITGYEVTATNPTTGAVVAGPISVTPGTASSYSSGTLLSAVLVGTYNINVKTVYGNWRSTAITWPVTVVVLGLLVACA